MTARGQSLPAPRRCGRWQRSFPIQHRWGQNVFPGSLVYRLARPPILAVGTFVRIEVAWSYAEIGFGLSLYFLRNSLPDSDDHTPAAFVSMAPRSAQNWLYRTTM